MVFLPKVGGGGEGINDQKVWGKFQSRRYCSSLLWVNTGKFFGALRKVLNLTGP